MRRPVFPLALLALASCAPPGGPGVSDSLTRATAPGVEVELANWAYWNNDCAAEPFEAVVAKAPLNGRVELRPGVFAIPERTSDGRSTGCVDRIIESTQAFYIPDPGFTGSDAVELRFSGSSGTVRNAYAVTVR